MLRGKRRLLTRPLLAATVLVVLIAAGSLASATASAAETDLGAIGFGAIVVDNARGHVLVSGPRANVVDVLDFAGNLLATIPSIDGAYGMVIKGHTLFVAESTAGAVVEVNLKTLAVTKSPLVTGLRNPRWLAIAGGALWITTGSEHGWGGLAAVSFASRELRQFEEDAYYEPDLATTPANHDELFVASDGVSPGSIYRLNVSSGAPVVAASGIGLNQENIEGLAVSPSGKRVIPASGWPYDFEELSAKTLKPDGIVYPGKRIRQPWPSHGVRRTCWRPGSARRLARISESSRSAASRRSSKRRRPAQGKLTASLRTGSRSARMGRRCSLRTSVMCTKMKRC